MEARLSALGHKRTFCDAAAMSALPPKADMCGAATDVRFGPKADIAGLIQSPHQRVAGVVTTRRDLMPSPS
jgi:hypothetical protein